MANTIYVPVGGLSDEVEKLYASVGGLSKEVIKGYCSVGGLSKRFYGSGGSSLIFEYDYQNNTIYSIHNYLTLEYVLDTAFAEFVRDYGSYSTQYTHLAYFINNWQTIKTGLLTYITTEGFDIQTFNVTFMCSKSLPSTQVQIDFGDNVFPKNVKMSTPCKKTDNFGNTYYEINASSSTMPQKTKYVYADTSGSSYRTGWGNASGGMQYIGLYSNENSYAYRTQMANFGMKLV